MKKIISSLLIIICLFMIVGCNSKKDEKNIQNSSTDQQEENIDNNELYNSNEVINSVKATINGKEYTINLEDNETSKSFINMLPQEFKMEELNSNEKYVYLDNTLPLNSSNPKKINAGDVMLYGNNCLVLFYKTFDTTYSYTKIGHINNMPDLGNENITVKFEKNN